MVQKYDAKYRDVISSGRIKFPGLKNKYANVNFYFYSLI